MIKADQRVAEAARSGIGRRKFLMGAIAAAVPVAVVGMPPLAGAAERSGRPLKVICIGAHPDDPESGCGGTLAHYAALGHLVTIVYLTRGERGILNTGLEEAARIRSAEAEAACRVIGGTPHFFGQIDGDTRVTREEADRLGKWLAAENPDVVFAHWPVDTHLDHQVASVLAIRACMQMGNRPHLYFFEVDTGDQSRGFLPNTYVEISKFLEKKKFALFAHKSQDGEGIWRQHHEVISKWRGREMGVAAAEAFVRYNYGSGLGPVGI